MGTGVNQEINVRIKALIDGLGGVKEFQSALKKIQADGNKKFDIGGGSLQGNAQKAIALFRQLSGASDTLAGQAESAAGALGLAGGSLGTVAVAGGAALGIIVGLGAGIFKLAEFSAKAGAGLSDLSAKTGFSVEDLSAFRLATEKSGVSIEQFGSFLTKFQINLVEARQGNRELRAEFNQLGVDINGEPRQALAQFFAGLQNLTNEEERLEVASKLGGKAAKELGGAFKEIGGDLDAFIATAHKLGFVIDAETARAADEFDDTLAVLKVVVASAIQQLGSELLPEVTHVMQDITGEVADNQSTFRGWGAEIAAVVRGVRLAAESDLGALLSIILQVHSALSGATSLGAALINTHPGLQLLNTLRGVGQTNAPRPAGPPGLLELTTTSLPNSRLPTSKKDTSGGGGKGGGSNDAQKALQQRLKLLEQELRAVEAVAKRETTVLEREFEQRRLSLRQYTADAIAVEDNRFEQVQAILLTELAEVDQHDKDRVTKVNELNQKLADEDEKHNQTVTRLLDERHKKEEQAARAHREAVLAIQEQTDTNRIAKLQDAAQRDIFIAAAAEDEILRIRLAALERRKQLLKEDEIAAGENKEVYQQIHDELGSSKSKRLPSQRRRSAASATHIGRRKMRSGASLKTANSKSTRTQRSK